ncbi:MAG TPA: hypothetical protein VFB78_09490 [Acidimicrobiales bacterium]|nr:hypothetical protein [Acidimicrobiales bacterium]
MAAVAALALFGSVSVAHAQTTTTTPCGSGTGVACGFDRSQDLGNKKEGDTFSIQNNCAFSGTTNKTFNGNPAGTGTGQCPTTVVTIFDDGLGNPTALGRLQPLFAAVGLHVAQGVRVPRVKVDNILFNASNLGVKNAIVLNGTAADTESAAGKWTNYFTIVGPGGGVGGSGLSRTGAMILRWSLLGGALVAVGALMLMSSRRRRTA